MYLSDTLYKEARRLRQYSERHVNGVPCRLPLKSFCTCLCIKQTFKRPHFSNDFYFDNRFTPCVSRWKYFLYLLYTELQN